MPIDEARARKLLRDFNLTALFVEELGWDKHKATLSIPMEDKTFELSALAEKRGMATFACECDGGLPDYNVRRKIERQVAKSAHEHFIIFTDRAKTRQIWQWVKREPGKPAAAREHHFDRSQTGEALLQKLRNVAFDLVEEENLTLVDVTIRARAGFDVEKVTKRFYERFQKEHAAFLKFIRGIPDDQLQRWYASVMLNRLMFIYFIQKKGFLDGDPNYLRNKLAASTLKDRYFSHFLCPLFFEGFAKKAEDRPAAANQLLGRIPYLNGGLFLRHQIEELHDKSIEIPDTAFERIFDFFEAYQWHLDERPLRADNEINPDVLGYIFEKYINAIQPGEQKAQGAYYTKEDITEYIGKNTVLPFLFDAARPKCKIAFENPNGPTIWDLLRSNPDRYIYDPVKKGADIPLPKEIEAGINDVAKRGNWNRLAPSEFTLPTEIWREVIARRQRYQDVRKKLAAGEARDINALITLNLDIRQFAQDVIENSEGPELLRAFWHAIENVTVLDPACGSGAFLFAALNILEPLYESCLDRMTAFVEELDRSTEKHRPEKFSDFRKVLDRVAAHPSRRYFVFKTIILNNLFGVDIMEEATEICKLRLFLKLAAQVQPDARKENFGIEPLPDIDFNIRAGNTLVGYATPDEVRRSMQEFGSGQMRLGVEDELKSYARFAENVETADRLFREFRAMQDERGMKVQEFTKAKETLRERLRNLEGELNQYLASEYGVKPNDANRYAAWLKSHHPFHWFVDFYGIMSKGGFDVIVGNPPYVEYSKVRNTYSVRDYATEQCGNLYIYFLERATVLSPKFGRIGFIVPIALVSVSETAVARKVLLNRFSVGWFSNFAIRPAKLFEGVEQRLTIWLAGRSTDNRLSIHTTNYLQWYKAERPVLFSRLVFGDASKLVSESCLPKLGGPIARDLVGKIGAIRGATVSENLVRFGQHKLYFHRTPGYWIRIMDFEPHFRSPTATRSVHHIRELYVRDKQIAKFIGAVVSSSLYFWWFFAVGNCRNLTLEDVKNFPIGRVLPENLAKIAKLFDQLMSDFKKNSFINTRGDTEFQEFNWGLSKPIIDRIDAALGKHYNLTDEEIDFVSNYDIKIRMSLGGGAAEE